MEYIDYRELHRDTINKLHQMVNSGKITVETACSICADFVPESIKEDIITYLSTVEDKELIPYETWIAWLEKQGKNNMGISEATKQKLEDNLNKALEKETAESWNKFLDEQGEQKPTDKFHEGDWVVISTSDGEKVVQIDSIEYFKNGKPRYITSEGRWFGNGTEARLWNIAKEAKDGDVLVASDGSIFIFKGTINCACKHYIALATDGAIEINEGLKHYWETSRAVHPATKEQRDTLLKAMADIGYTFDFEKKELKKIEQSPAWSEEDIELLDNTIKFIEDRVAATSPSLRTYIPTLTGKEIPFLKALKDRVQPKQEWSEKDNRICKAIIDNIQAICEEGYFVGNINSNELIKWLKSLRP